MIKRPFNLERYNEMYPKPELITRTGMPARILATDIRSDKYPVAAAVTERDNELVFSFSADGKANVRYTSAWDLFMFCRF